MTEEIWKDVPGYEGLYKVSDAGRVRSLSFMQRYLLRTGAEAFRRTAEKILAANVNNSGYLLVHLHKDNERSARTLHRLVAQAFVPNPEGLPEVNHKDGVKANCAAGNLEWATRTENIQHALRTGLLKRSRPVTAPSGRNYPSINAAAVGERVRRTTARGWQL